METKQTEKPQLHKPTMEFMLKRDLFRCVYHLSEIGVSAEDVIEVVSDAETWFKFRSSKSDDNGKRATES